MRALALLLFGLLGVMSLRAQEGGAAPPPPAAAARAQDPVPRAAPDEGAVQEPDAAAGPRGSRSQRRATSLFESRLQALDNRYPWLAPTESYQWVSLGVTVFALLSLAIHIAARLAATDLLGFGRATLIALWIMLVGFVQVAVVSSAGHALALAVLFNAVFLLLCFRFVYRLTVPASGLAVFLLAVQLGLGFALLRLVDATLRSIGNTTFTRF